MRVLDVGTLPTGEPFMVMELLEGKDFKQILQDRGPLPPAEAALYMIQTCAALQEAHALGIVHRDLKARNLFVTKRVDGTPCVKVLDFGISKMEAGDVAPLTLPDMGMGSPRYMAPEQWTSASTVDSRADIYAAGAVLYELLTGQIPLAGLQLVEVIKRIRAGAVPSPRELRPDLPDGICRVVMKALRPRPEERYPSAAELANALKDAVPDAVSETGTHPRPKKRMAATIPTAVVDREVLMARAAIEAHLAPSSAAPTPNERPPQRMPSSIEPSTNPKPFSSTHEDAPVAKAPQALAMENNDFAEDAQTIVTQGAMQPGPYEESASHHYATLQVAEVPPEIQALRARYNAPEPPQPAQRLPSPPPAPPPVAVPLPPHRPSPLPPKAPTHNPLGNQEHNNPGNVAPPRFTGGVVPVHQEPEPKRLPGWLFWILLVVSFCLAGGIVAAALTRVLQ